MSNGKNEYPSEPSEPSTGNKDTNTDDDSSYPEGPHWPHFVVNPNDDKVSPDMEPKEEEYDTPEEAEDEDFRHAG